MKIFRALAFVVLIAILAACNMPRSVPEPTLDPDLVATMVEETLAGFTTPTVEFSSTTLPTPTVTSLPQPTITPLISKVSGKVCFPSSGRTDLQGFFQEIIRGTVTELAIPASANDYEVALDPGTYIAYAWLPDFSNSGMYSTGSVPTPFEVTAGQTTIEINLCDWSHGPFDIPYPPGYEPQQTTGSISGSVTYPYGAIPQLTLVAFSKSTPYWYWIGTASGQGYFSITNLPPGKYRVVAYDASGHTGGSEVVTVIAGQSTTANVSDWGGSFPDNPVK